MFMEVDIVTNDPEPEPDVFMLVCDDDGHWYVINQNNEDDFYVWVEATVNGKNSEFDFEDCRLSGSPTRVRFHSWWEK